MEYNFSQVPKDQLKIIYDAIGKDYLNTLPRSFKTNANTISKKFSDIIKLQGELKLVHQKIDTIKNNHLKHMDDKINNIYKILWFVAALHIKSSQSSLKSNKIDISARQKKHLLKVWWVNKKLRARLTKQGFACAKSCDQLVRYCYSR